MAEFGSSTFFGDVSAVRVFENGERMGTLTYINGEITLVRSDLESFASNADNLSSGTVAEARLPAAALVGDTTYSAGNGLNLSGTSFTLGTPLNLTGNTGNSVTAGGHSHSVSSTDSRTSTSTAVLLTAKGMNDHSNSGDHDARYVRKTGDVLSGTLEINEPSGSPYFRLVNSTNRGGLMAGPFEDALGQTVGDTELAIRTRHSSGAGSENINTVFHNNGGISVNGPIHAEGDVTAFSDARKKDDIERIPQALSKTLRLNGYTYTRLDTPGKRYTGVIAQEVLQVLPEAVRDGPTDENPDAYYSVAYGNMIGLLIEAVKEQQKQIEYLNKYPWWLRCLIKRFGK